MYFSCACESATALVDPAADVRMARPSVPRATELNFAVPPGAATDAPYADELRAKSILNGIVVSATSALRPALEPFIRVTGVRPARRTMVGLSRQAGVAAGVMNAHRKGVLIADDADDLVLVAAVWVNPDADDEDAVYTNNAGATLAALTAGRDDLPSVRTVLDVGEPRNPYFRA